MFFSTACLDWLDFHTTHTPAGSTAAFYTHRHHHSQMSTIPLRRVCATPRSIAGLRRLQRQQRRRCLSASAAESDTVGFVGLGKIGFAINPGGGKHFCFPGPGSISDF